MPRVTDVAREIAAVFGRAAPTYDTVIPFFGAFGAKLVAWAGLAPGEAVLDVGSGRGATLFPAAERVGAGGRVLGVDLAPEMVAAVRDDLAAAALAHASILQMDAQELNVEPQTFDAVLSGFVLQLLPDPDRAAAGMARALRPGGRCVVATPTGPLSGWTFLGTLFAKYAPRAPRPLVTPYRPDFDPSVPLAAAGLDIVDQATEHVAFHLGSEQAWWDWAWSQGMRGLLEALTAVDLEAMRHEMFAELATRRAHDGIPMTQAAAFVLARKP